MLSFLSWSDLQVKGSNLFSEQLTLWDIFEIHPLGFLPNYLRDYFFWPISWCRKKPTTRVHASYQGFSNLDPTTQQEASHLPFWPEWGEDVPRYAAVPKRPSSCGPLPARIIPFSMVIVVVPKTWGCGPPSKWPFMAYKWRVTNYLLTGMILQVYNKHFPV